MTLISIKAIRPLLLLIYLGCTTVELFAQINRQAFHAVVVDESFDPIGGAYVKNMRSNEFGITDASGNFQINCLKNDSLLINAMGYELKKIYAVEFNIPFIKLKRMTHTLKQVTVYDFKGWDAFKKEFLETEIPGEKINITGLPKGIPSQKPINLRPNTFNEKPGPIHFIVHPFSSLAYYTSSEEKQKRKVWRLMIRENNELAYWQVMNTDSIKKWGIVHDSLISPFIIYCNLKIENKGLGSAYYFKEKLGELYPLFLEERRSEN